MKFRPSKSSHLLVGFLVFVFLLGCVFHTCLAFTFCPCVNNEPKGVKNGEPRNRGLKKKTREGFELPPRAFPGDQQRNSIASDSCPDKLRRTRAGVSAYRTYEDHSITNPHVFPSMDEYLVYAHTMKELYGCPILEPDDDIPLSQKNMFLPPPAPVVPTYASDGYNTHSRVRGVDPVGYYDWEYTTLDENNRSRREDQVISDMPSDPNWGGPKYSEYMLFSGKHKGSTVVTNRPIVKYPTNVF